MNMFVSTEPLLLDGPLAPGRGLTKKQRLISEMADWLLKYEAWRTEGDATLSLYANGKGPFSLFEVMLYRDDARQVAAQEMVAKIMSEPQEEEI